MRDEASDEALAERVRATGDVMAFALLVTRYRVRVVALARRMLAATGPDEAEDIAQEAFVAAYDKRATFRRGQPFRPWLYRIAVNRCLDRLRVQARRPALLDISSVSEPALIGGDPLDALLNEEGEQRLSEAVATLPPKLRAVFLLRHLDDLSYEEIAIAAGVPLGTVKTHLFRARALLRAALSEYLKP
ncbi:MAG: sigma-70 family RNA polymerase sigma factor [Armatimonadota bacterium]|nr:sigma-70 family RNA polymerase sigma factor [Armatimonadota bacterium]